MKERRTAFTLVEVLATIFVIALLIALVTVAVSKVMESSRASSTKTIIQTGVNLFEEWKRAGTANYPTFPWPKEILPASIDVDGTGLNSVGFQLSRATMYRMQSMASVKNLINKMPAERFDPTTVDYSGLPTTVPGWNDTNFTTGTVPPQLSIPGYAFKGTFNKKTGTGDRFFICFNGLGTTAAALSPTNADPSLWPDGFQNYWMESTGGDIQMIRDAWNRPLLILPSCGVEATDITGNTILLTSDGPKNQFFSGSATCFLDRLLWKAGRSYILKDIVAAPLAGSSTGQWGLFMCIQPNTSAVANQPDSSGGKNYWDRVPTVPFFASAGPDAVFYDPNEPKTLEDNVYSNER